VIGARDGLGVGADTDGDAVGKLVLGLVVGLVVGPVEGTLVGRRLLEQSNSHEVSPSICKDRASIMPQCLFT